MLYTCDITSEQYVCTVKIEATYYYVFYAYY